MIIIHLPPQNKSLENIQRDFSESSICKVNSNIELSMILFICGVGGRTNFKGQINKLKHI